MSEESKTPFIEQGTSCGIEVEAKEHEVLLWQHQRQGNIHVENSNVPKLIGVLQNIKNGGKKEGYVFVQFESRDIQPDTEENYNRIKADLGKLIRECAFIVTNYSTMYSSFDIKVEDGHRGPILSDKNGYDWWYNINGGYKINPHGR